MKPRAKANETGVRHRPGHRRVPEALSDESKSVLAVLVLASIWQAEFEGGWVSRENFQQVAKKLGPPRKRQSLKAAIRRGLRDALRLTDPPVVERRPAEGKSREDERRLRPPIPGAIEDWLLAEGDSLITAVVWEKFRRTHFEPARTLQEIRSGLLEIVVWGRLVRGEHEEAIRRARTALRHARSARERRALALALAAALLRRSRPADWREAGRMLRVLVRQPIAAVDLSDRLTESRTWVALAYAEFLGHVRKRLEGQQVRRHIGSIRKLLRRAEAVTGALSLGDRAQVVNLEGLLLKWEAQIKPDVPRRDLLFNRADRYLRQALDFWRQARDTDGVSAALYNLAELRFARFRLHRGLGTDAEVRETLRWYEASISFGEALGGQFDRVLDYAKAAECCVLLSGRSFSQQPKQRQRLIAMAREHLEKARSFSESGSWQLKLLDRIEAMIPRQ